MILFIQNKSQTVSSSVDCNANTIVSQQELTATVIRPLDVRSKCIPYPVPEVESLWEAEGIRPIGGLI